MITSRIPIIDFSLRIYSGYNVTTPDCNFLNRDP